MIEEFSKIIKEIGVAKNTRILLAISGGVDSMVLFDLFQKTTSMDHMRIRPLVLWIYLFPLLQYKP